MAGQSCETCGAALARDEIRCTRCAMATAIPDDYGILIAGSSLRYRLIRTITIAITWAAIGVAVFALVMGLQYSVLPLLFSGTFLSILRVVVALVGILGPLMCIGIGYAMVGEVWRDATFSVTKTRLVFNEVVRTSEETKFVDRSHELSDIRKINIVKGWLGRRLGYGDVELFIKEGARPTVVIAGLLEPERFAKKLEYIMKYPAAPLPDAKPAVGPDQASATRRSSAAMVVAGSLLLPALIWVGGWYRATIDDWDYCVLHDQCFVCHKPAVASAGGEGMGLNVRLCPEHSTGLQAWRWIVYGVPAMMLIYEDAPLGSGRFMQPLMRGALIVGWGAGILACGLGIILGVISFIAPRTAFSILRRV